MTTVLEHTYLRRGASKELFDYEGAEVLLSGPAGTGKSRGCLERLLWLALKYPGIRVLIIRKTAVSARASILVEFRETVLPVWLQAGVVKWYGGSARESAQYQFSNGSVIVLNGMDNASRIMSTQYDVIYINEAFELTENEWEICTTRLRNYKMPFQQLIADTNPQGPTHWLKQRCERGQTKMLYARFTDNPFFTHSDGAYTAEGRDYIENRMGALTGVRRERLLHGIWAAAEGVIYENWDENVHLVPRAPIPFEWPRFWSIDFGFNHPFVCQMWAQDPDGQLILDREIYHTGVIVEEHAKVMKALITPSAPGREPKHPKPKWIVADHDAEGRATFEKYFGQSTLPARKSVLEGIEAVMSRLKVGKDGRPRLVIMRDAVLKVDPSRREAKKPTCTEQEITGYVWADGGKKKEEPVKIDDDGMDAMRYVVAQLDTGVRSRVRFVDL